MLSCSSFIAETAVYGVPLSSRVVMFGQGMLLARFALCLICGLYALHVVCILDIMSSLDFLFLFDEITEVAAIIWGNHEASEGVVAFPATCSLSVCVCSSISGPVGCATRLRSVIC